MSREDSEIIKNRMLESQQSIVCNTHKQQLTHICLYSPMPREIFSLYCVKCIQHNSTEKGNQKRIIQPYPKFFLQQVTDEIKVQKGVESSGNALEGSSLSKYIETTITKIESQYDQLSQIERTVQKLKRFLYGEKERLQKSVQTITKGSDLLTDILKKVSEDQTHIKIQNHLREFNVVRDGESQIYRLDQEKCFQEQKKQIFSLDLVAIENSITELRQKSDDLELRYLDSDFKFVVNQNPSLFDQSGDQSPTSKMTMNNSQNYPSNTSNSPPRITDANSDQVSTKDIGAMKGSDFNNRLMMIRQYGQFHDAGRVYQVQFLSDTLVGILLMRDSQNLLEICSIDKNFDCIFSIDLGPHRNGWFQNFSRIDEQIMVVGVYRTLRIFNYITGKELKVVQFTNSYINSVLSFDRDYILASDEESFSVFLFRLKVNDKPEMTFDGHSDMVYELAKFDNDHFISCSADTTVRIWNIRKPVQEVYLKMDSQVISVTVSNSQKEFFCGLHNGFVIQFNVSFPLSEIEKSQVIYNTGMDKIIKILPIRDDIFISTSKGGAKFIQIKSKNIFDVGNNAQQNGSWSYTISSIDRKNDSLVCYSYLNSENLVLMGIKGDKN